MVQGTLHKAKPVHLRLWVYTDTNTGQQSNHAVVAVNNQHIHPAAFFHEKTNQNDASAKKLNTAMNLRQTYEIGAFYDRTKILNAQ
jgi:hypothetical protein